MSGLANHPDDSIPVKECICKYCCPLHLQKAREEITALRARLQKQEEDTKRLDWANRQARWSDDKNSVRIMFPIETVTFITLREAIDAALSQTPAQ